MADYEPPKFNDDSPLAEAEIDMLKLLSQEQADAVASWLKLYGHAFASENKRCARILTTNFSYAANRLEIIVKNKKEILSGLEDETDEDK